MAAYNAKLRSGSFVLLGLALASWVIALGGLGAINWLVCSDTANTIADIAANAGASATAGVSVAATAAANDVAVCSRAWKWEWWTLFYTFTILVAGIIVTALPKRLPRARFPLANLLSISCVLIMVSLNSDIQVVFDFFDTYKTFDGAQGVLRKLYMSAAALVAGWIMTVIFSLIWIGFALDTDTAAAEEGAAPITNDAEAATRKT